MCENIPLNNASTPWHLYLQSITLLHVESNMIRIIKAKYRSSDKSPDSKFRMAKIELKITIEELGIDLSFLYQTYHLCTEVDHSLDNLLAKYCMK